MPAWAQTINEPAHASAPDYKSESEMFACFTDSIHAYLKNQLAAGSKKTFHDMEEVKQFALTLTPAGFLKNPVLLPGCAARMQSFRDPQAFARLTSDYAKSHPEEMNRFLSDLEEKLKPDFMAFALAVSKQFQVNWLSDPASALQSGKAAKRPTFILICADWALLCKELEITIASAEVRSILNESYIAVKIDLSEPVSPEVENFIVQNKAKYAPVMIVLDTNGKVSGRINGLASTEQIISFLESKKAPRPRP